MVGAMPGASILLAVLGFAFVIIIHELGHFLVAKWAGVKVLRFSIGFPPIVWSKRIGETDYSVGLLWLGGYVKMLGEAEDADGRDDPRSFTSASAGWRALILLGGVTFNLVSSWLLLICLAWYGMPAVAPVVGTVQFEMADPDHPEQRVPSPAARLGLRIGDRIEAINGRRTYSFEDDVMHAIAGAGRKPLSIEVLRDGQRLTLAGDRERLPVHALSDREYGIPVLGIEPATSLRIGDAIDAFGSGTSVPVRPDWTLRAIDGVEIPAEAIGQVVQAGLERRIGEQVTFVFSDPAGGRREVAVRYAGGGLPLDLAIGLPVRVAAPPAVGTPAAGAGLLAGDAIVAVDGIAISGQAHVIALIQRAVADRRDARLRVWRAEPAGAAPAGYRDTVATPREDSDGRWRIGAALEPIFAGRLPDALPPAMDGQPNALVAAGWQTGDVLLEVPITAQSEDAEAIARARTEGTLAVRVLRGATVERVVLAEAPDKATRVTLASLIGRQVESSTPGAVVLAPVGAGKPTSVALDKFPALRGALSSARAGDWIVRAGPAAVGAGWELELARAPGAPITLTAALRDGGVAFSFRRDSQPIPVQGLAGVIALANHFTWYLPADVLSFIPKFFQSHAEGGIDATKTLSGPIGIFSALKTSSESSFARFLKLVALIGLNLFLINLLPIPVVDGGQLTILAIETVIRRPLPEPMKIAFTYLGIAVVVSLMLFALSLDILRKFGVV